MRYHQNFGNGLPAKYARVCARLPGAGSVLEVGCHTGYFTRHLKSLGLDVVGLERDDDAASVARKEGLPVLTGDIERPETLAPIGRRFDRVLLMDVLEHLVDPAAALRALRAFLEEGGKVMVTGPNVGYWAIRKDLLLGRFRYADGGIMDRTHLRFYAEEGWRALLQEAGFRIDRFETADAMIPLESRLTRLPGVAPVVAAIKTGAVAAFPRLFAIDFLIEATPG